MKIHSTLLYKHRDKIQIQILRKIATDGKHSKKSLENTLEKHHPVIDNAVNQLLKKNLITHTYGNLDNKRGQPEKFYRLTEEGISILIDEIKIPLNEFWKMLFRIFDSEGNFYANRYINSKGRYIDKRNFIFKNFTIDKLIKKYENNVLGYKRERALPNMSPKISDIQLITDCKLTPSEKIIIETFALYDSLSIAELTTKLSKHISSIPQKLFDLYFLIKTSNNKKYEITVLGMQYLMFVIFKQLKHDTQMQKIKIILENQKNTLPLIFRKWTWLTRFFSNRELFNALIDAIDTNQRQLPFQTDSGIQEILDSHRNLEEVCKSKIKREYDVGLETDFEVRYEKGGSLEELLSIDNVDKPIQLVMTALDKLKVLLGLDSVEESHLDEIKKQQLVEYEQIKSDSLSFRFYSILLSQIYQKNEEPDQWSNFLKTDKEIMPWYGNWIKEIGDFERKNIDYRNNLAHVLSS